MKLKDIGTIVTGNTPSKRNNEYYESDDILFVKPSDIEENYITNIESSEEYISEKAREKARILPEGAVLVTCIGTIGKVGILSQEATCNQQINAIIPNDKVISKYLAYLIQSKQKILKLKANAPVVPIINKTDFSEIEINICDVNKQKEIVDQLDLLKTIIDKRKIQIEELQNIIKSQFVEMFENENKYVNLEDVCVFINGDRGKNYPSADKISKDPSGIPFINAGLLINNTVDWKNMNYISEDTYNKLGSGKIQKEDILYCLRGSLGKHSIIDFDGKGAIASSLVILRADKSKIQPDFLLIQLGMDEILRQQNQANNGSSQPNLSAGSVKKYIIKLPSLELQNKFAEFVKQVDKQKFEIENSLKEIQELYESLMEKYFG